MKREYLVFDTDARGGFQALGAQGADAGPGFSVVELTADEVMQRRKSGRLLLPSMALRAIRPHKKAAATGQPTWGLAAIGVTEPRAYTGKGVVVAVLDTGIDKNHPAFAGMEHKIVEKDFTGEGNGDGDGHGTHVAATICGQAVAGQAIGVAPGIAKLLVGKVLGADGSGTTKGIYQAMAWAMEAGANVISMSLGLDPFAYWEELRKAKVTPRAALSDVLDDYRVGVRTFDRLMAYLESRGADGSGALVVAASGNESEHPKEGVSASLPAAADDILSVGAIDVDGKLASFSNTRPEVVAPGVDIVSAEAGGKGLVAFDGTSMAAPHVAGIAALWWEALAREGLDPTARSVLARVRATASPKGLDPGLTVHERGLGRVRAPRTEDFA